MRLDNVLKGLKGNSGKHYTEVDVYRKWYGSLTTSQNPVKKQELDDLGIEMHTPMDSEIAPFFTASRDGKRHFIKPLHSLSKEFEVYAHLLGKGVSHPAMLFPDDIIYIEKTAYLVYPFMSFSDSNDESNGKEGNNGRNISNKSNGSNGKDVIKGREETHGTHKIGRRNESAVSRSLGDSVRDYEFADCPKTIACIGAAIADFLEFLHSNNILYLDLKPDNIVLCPGDLDYPLRFIDFESSRLAKRTSSGLQIKIDLDDPILYTDLYAASELVAMHDIITEEADIYAAGCILNDLFTGERTCDNVDRYIRLSDVHNNYPKLIAEIMAEHGEDGLKRYDFLVPSSIKEAAESIPIWMNNAISGCVKIKPEERYKSTELKRKLMDAAIIQDETDLKPILQGILACSGEYKVN